MANFYGEYETKAALDAAYDVESSVPDISFYGDKFIAESDAVRHDLPHTLGVKYGPTLMERLDIFPPRAGDGMAPAVLFIHGGYWRQFTATDFSLVARGPIMAGMGVFNVTYELCPVVSIPEIVRQIRAAIVWVRKHAADHGCDPDQIIILGHSAGAHLAAMAAFTDWTQYGIRGGGIIRGVVAVSGLFDLEPIASSFMQPILRLTADVVRWQSPIRNIRRVDVPFVVAWGDAEPKAFIEQSKSFASALKEHRNIVDTVCLPGANHFEVLDSMSKGDGILVEIIKKIRKQAMAPSEEK